MSSRIVFTLAIVLALALPAWTAPAPAPVCVGARGALTAEATPVVLQPFIEVALVLHGGAERVAFDPARVVLEAGGVQLTPLTPAQAKSRVRDVGGHLFALLLGPVGLAATLASQAYTTRGIDTRALRAQELASGGEVRGSLFFAPVEPAPKRAILTLPLVGGEGERELRLVCPVMTTQTGQPPAAITTLALVARSDGVIRVDVPFAEFSPDATVLDVRLENPTEGDADVFAGLAGAVLQAGGVAYPVMAARSDLIEQIPSRGTVRIRLVFPPLPSPGADWRGVLLLPVVRMGGEEREVRVELAR